MTFRKLLFLSLILAVAMSACNNSGGTAAPSLSSTEDSLAYSLGVDYASSLAKAEITGLNVEAFSKGLNDVLSAKDLEVTEEEVAQQVRDFVTKMRNPEATAEDKNINDEKIAYAFGIDYGKNLQQSGLSDFNQNAFSSAVTATMAGESEDNVLLISADEAGKIIQREFTAIQAKAGEVNKAKGEEFLTKNKERSEIKVTDSGLQYEVMTEGTGAIPAAEDKVKVHYHGTLIDGTVFDSSVDRGEPAEFPVGGVIKGWVEALQLMPTGSKWKLYIPSDLAYGERGAGGDIGPHETLIFEVELLEILGK